VGIHIKINIGAELKQLRVSKGLTQEQAADLFATSQDRISKIENNRLRIKADEYVEYKHALEGTEKVASFNIDFREKEGCL
jgi:transcriptional regulator with XRE-family HTH domain